MIKRTAPIILSACLASPLQAHDLTNDSFKDARLIFLKLALCKTIYENKPAVKQLGRYRNLALPRGLTEQKYNQIDKKERSVSKAYWTAFFASKSAKEGAKEIALNTVWSPKGHDW